MFKNFGPKTWVLPMPVLIIGTYDEEGNPDMMNAAWGGTYDANQITISMSEHQTTKNFMKTKCFTVSFADDKHVKECDYFGIVSASKVKDKVLKSGMKVVKSKNINAPILEELPITLECELVSFVDGTLIGNIKNVVAREDVLGEDGLPSYDKFTLITFDPIRHKYIALGKAVGNAFQDGMLIK